MDSTKDIDFSSIPLVASHLSATTAIFDTVQIVRADVSTVALGITASTASIILRVGTKGKRLAIPNTRIMIHQPLGSASGVAIDVEIQARETRGYAQQEQCHQNHIEFSAVGPLIKCRRISIGIDACLQLKQLNMDGIVDGVIDKDSIIPLMPVPERVKSPLNYEEISKDPKKILETR